MNDPGVTVLVTGAMGNLGARVTETLLERGHEVIALDSDPERGPPLLPHGHAEDVQRPGVAGLAGEDAVAKPRRHA